VPNQLSEPRRQTGAAPRPPLDPGKGRALRRGQRDPTLVVHHRHGNRLQTENEQSRTFPSRTTRTRGTLTCPPIGLDTASQLALHTRPPPRGPRPAFVLRRNHPTSARRETQLAWTAAPLPLPCASPRHAASGLAPGELGERVRTAAGAWCAWPTSDSMGRLLPRAMAAGERTARAAGFTMDVATNVAPYSCVSARAGRFRRCRPEPRQSRRLLGRSAFRARAGVKATRSPDRAVAVLPPARPD
jgi:hypothetical protein